MTEYDKKVIEYEERKRMMEDEEVMIYRMFLEEEQRINQEREELAKARRKRIAREIATSRGWKE